MAHPQADPTHKVLQPAMQTKLASCWIGLCKYEANIAWAQILRKLPPPPQKKSPLNLGNGFIQGF